MPIRILLADDRKMVRDDLRKLIEEESDMAVVGEAADGEETVRLVRKVLPNLVIMDVVMPGMNGIECTKHILDEFPGMKILAVSMYSDRQFVKGMLSAGAKGYLLKDHVFEELAAAIRRVTADEMFLSEEISRNLEKNNNTAF